VILEEFKTLRRAVAWAKKNMGTEYPFTKDKI
jgi:hypothetical protein